MRADADRTAEISEQVRRHLAAGKVVRIHLAPWGRLHLDRQLPFLAVYRRPPGTVDTGTDRLLLGESAYLLGDGAAGQLGFLRGLLSDIARVQIGAFGAFLVLEIWSTRGSEPPRSSMLFRIHAARHHAPATTLEALENALLGITVDESPSSVEVVYDDAPAPPDLPALLDAETLSAVGATCLGLELSPIYRHADTGELFPFELRALHHGLTRALKLAFYAFTHARTTHRPSHYQALGRRAMTNAVWRTDRTLAELSERFDLLLHVTPVNSAAAWREFEDGGFERVPEFLYRPRTVDPDLVKRQLYQLPIEDIEDPAVTAIFNAKRYELDQQCDLIADRNTARFLLGSRRLYGDVDMTLLGEAREILQSLPAHEDGGAPEGLDAPAFAERARRELEYYRAQDPSFATRVELRDDVTGIMVSKGDFLIGTDAVVAGDGVRAALAHEIGTHALTYHNGRQQPFQELYAGMAGYEPMQEGLAVLAEYLSGELRRGRLRVLAARVIAVDQIAQGADFIESFRVLHREHGFPRKTAFTIAMRVFRGGGYTKDAVYLRGLIQVLDCLAEGHDLEQLLIGKLAYEHLHLIEELQWRGVLKSPRLRPRYMAETGYAARLAKLRERLPLAALVSGGV